MGSKLITSYAALGVGLAIVLTFGLGAISSVMEQPSEKQSTAGPESLGMAPVQSMPKAEKALEAPRAAPPPPMAGAPLPAPPAERSETQQNVSAKAAAPAGTSATTLGDVVLERAPASKEEMSKEIVFLPYIAAAVVGSVVFVVTRKRVGW